MKGLSQDYFNKVAKYFRGDTEKLFKWFETPLLTAKGDSLSPKELIRKSRTNELQAHIDKHMRA